jgi:hypothetical protein
LQIDKTVDDPAAAQSKLTRSYRIGDVLFLIQMITALGFVGTQGRLMLTTTEGISLTWLSFWGVFLLINLSLSSRAHQLQPSRVTFQTVFTYATWSVVVVLCIGIYIWRNVTIWTAVDTWTTGLAFSGIAVTLAVGYRNKLTITDPIVRGYLAVFFKGVPQLTLACNILMSGGAGISTFAIVTGHFNICTRLGQVLMSLREAAWDRNRRGSAISEIANEGTWIVATIAWIMVL